MSIRKFVFCDICNPLGLRSVEFRRAPRPDQRNGRRISDNRAWYEGEVAEAIKLAGWISFEGKHICPICQKNHPDLGKSLRTVEAAN